MSPKGLGWIWASVLLIAVAGGGCGSSDAGEPLDGEDDVQQFFDTIAPALAALLAERLTLFQQKEYPDCPGGGMLWVDPGGTAASFFRCRMEGIAIDGSTTAFAVIARTPPTVTLRGTFEISGSLVGTLVVDGATFVAGDSGLCWSATGSVADDHPFAVQSENQSCSQE